jgi:hypothetical protein
VAEAVVELAGLALRKHLVRLDDLAKPLLRVGSGGDVGVKLAGETPKSALDLRGARRASDPQDLVVVALRRRHQPSLAPTPQLSS